MYSMICFHANSADLKRLIPIKHVNQRSHLAAMLTISKYCIGYGWWYNPRKHKYCDTLYVYKISIMSDCGIELIEIII